MTFPQTNLNQTATYWAKTGNDGVGWFTFSTPTILACRWEDKNEVITDAEGKEIISDAKVFLGQDVVLSGFLYLGVSTEADPADVDGAKEIKKFNKTPDLTGTEFEYKAWLKRR